jgi:Protein of unknown function (DUF3574)
MALRRRPGFCRIVTACSMGVAGVIAGVLAGTPASACSAPLHPMQRVELMFGRNIHGRPGVGGTAWARFLASEITPRFPDGLTVVDAAGQWRDPAGGRLAREPSRLVIIVTAAGASADDRIAAIVAAYKQRFHQKSVGVVASAVCAAF